MKALLSVFAFNENVKIEKTCERIRAYLDSRGREIPVDVLVVDDASTDGYPEKLAACHGFHLIRNETRKGIGFSIRRAYDFAMAHGYDIAIVMAGNNKDDPEEAERLIRPIVEGNADFVQGSRYLQGGNFGNMPVYRQLATRFVHPWLFSLIAGKRITDSTNGFRALRLSILKDSRIRLHESWLDRYELEPYLFCQTIRLGYRVMEVPVTKIYPCKHLGYSKMKPVVGWWSILKPLFYLALKIKR